MPAQAIHHINIRAPRALMSELKDFYESVLGLREGWRPPFQSSGHWLYLGEVPWVHLVEDERVASADRTKGAIIDHVAFSCVGLQQSKELLQSKGIAFRQTQVPETSLVQLIFLDPAGNGVELQFAGVDA